MIIKNIKKEGYKIVPVSELIYKDNYIIDINGRQKKWSFLGRAKKGSPKIKKCTITKDE